MLNLEDLSQFVAFYKSGTLTKVAEDFHISQPTITRTMKRIEDTFEVPLFNRTANRISFNEVGIRAAMLAEELLASADHVLTEVQDYDRKLHTLNVVSCAPAPLWTLIPELTRTYGDITISSKLVDDVQQLEKDFLNKKCDIAILPYPLDGEGFTCSPYLEEQLSICVTSDHALAAFDKVTTNQINGHNCLLSSEIGFWSALCKTHMPSSKFLVQTDEFAFRELMKASSLPFFITNLTNLRFDDIPKRITIPIVDDCMNVTFYLCRWTSAASINEKRE